MKRKTVGVLGGMGPEATIRFLLEVVKRTPAEVDQHHIRILLDNNPNVPDRTEAILAEAPVLRERLLKDLVAMGRGLERQGADFLVMPCNTSHYFFDELEKCVDIPFLNMVKGTALEVGRRLGATSRKVGLLATRGTIKAMIYQNEFESFGVDVIGPGADQEGVTRAIYEVKAGGGDQNVRKLLSGAIQKFRKERVGTVILGCTELSLLSLGNWEQGIDFVDPVSILASNTVSFALGSAVVEASGGGISAMPR